MAFAEGGKLLQDGNTRRTYLVTTPEAKSYVVKHWFKPFKHCTRTVLEPSEARREWNWTLLARSKGLTSLEPLLLGERCWLGMVTEACIVYTALPSRFTVHQVLNGRALPSEVRQQAIVAFAQALASIHAQNMYHGDFSPENILLDENAPHTPQPNVIDWGTAGEIEPGNEAQPIQDLLVPLLSLMRLQMDQAEVSLFLDAYSKGAPWFRDDRARYEEELCSRVWEQAWSDLQRTMKNCTRKARRLQVGWHGFKKYFAFQGESVSEVLAAVQGNSTLYRAQEPLAIEIWRAANVLASWGLDRNGVAGFVIDRKPMGKARKFLAFRPDCKSSQFKAVIERAEELIAWTAAHSRSAKSTDGLPRQKVMLPDWRSVRPERQVETLEPRTAAAPLNGEVR